MISRSVYGSFSAQTGDLDVNVVTGIITNSAPGALSPFLILQVLDFRPGQDVANVLTISPIGTVMISRRRFKF